MKTATYQIAATETYAHAFCDCRKGWTTVTITKCGGEVRRGRETRHASEESAMKRLAKLVKEMEAAQIAAA